MRRHLCRVAGNKRLWSDVQCLTLDAPDLAQTVHPAQFALLRRPGSFDPYLRRKAWFYEADGGTISLTLSSADPMASSRDGDWLDLLAPLGRTADWSNGARHILLVGEGRQAAPLLGMARQAVQRGSSVLLSLIAARDQDVLPAHLLPPEVEYQASPTVNPELFGWADLVVASSSKAMYKDLGEAITGVRMRLEREFLKVMIDLPMPCGTGACLGCAIETSHGIKLACTDGPLFDWSNLNRRAW